MDLMRAAVALTDGPRNLVSYYYYVAESLSL